MGKEKNKTKKALITGITGQDGAYLAKFLLAKGYKVYGFFRREVNLNFWRLQYLNILDKIYLLPGDITDAGSIAEAIKISDPDEIYNLAAQSFVGASFEQPISTAEITGIGVLKMLEMIRQINPNIKFYQASTSELFGTGYKKTLNENSPFSPASPYSVAKLYGHWTTKVYRESYGIFACNGILFNHESPLRGLEFVTRKISNSVAKIALGLEKKLFLGNLEAKRDWGYAPDYVKGMWQMLQQERAQDYILATGETHSVRELVKRAFGIVGLKWKKYVEIDKRFFRPLDVEYLQGDYSKAKRELNWKPRVKFDGLVKIIVKEDMERWRKWIEGKKFPWDAPSYPEETKVLTRVLRM